MDPGMIWNIQLARHSNGDFCLHLLDWFSGFDVPSIRNYPQTFFLKYVSLNSSWNCFVLCNVTLCTSGTSTLNDHRLWTAAWFSRALLNPARNETTLSDYTREEKKEKKLLEPIYISNLFICWSESDKSCLRDELSWSCALNTSFVTLWFLLWDWRYWRWIW